MGFPPAVQCSSCGKTNPGDATRCASCDSLISHEDATITGSPDTRNPLGNTGHLYAPGAVLGGRYEIIQILGQGGMGAVYKTKDLELDRIVALKVVRGELLGHRRTLERFKQELLLARQITHRNVVRIYDIGTHEDIRFITMEFVEGRDLQSMLDDGVAFTLERKIDIVRQVCLALQAAHSEGVVHRDLKPQNIVIEPSGRVVVMDFGIARTVEEGSATSTVGLVGTIAYMSPEQAQGEKIDTRSDLFSLGIILYELLTGKSPYQSNTAAGLLLKRIQEHPVPPAERLAGVPQVLSDITVKCLTIDRQLRYQSASEVLGDLNSWSAPSANTRTETTRTQTTQSALPKATPNRRRLLWVAGPVAVALLIVAAFMLRGRFLPSESAPHAPVTVLVADITNETGEPIFNGTLEPVVNLALEGAGFISAYDRGSARSLAAQLSPGSAKFDEPAARLVAVNQGLDVVVGGTLRREKGGYTLSARAVQPVTGDLIATANVSAADKDQVLLTIPKMAAPIRKALGDPASESGQLFAMETLGSGSIEAVHQYGVALDRLYNSRYEEARAAFAKAAELDPNFGLAYAGLSVVSRNLGRPQEAEKFINLAITHIDRMTERERYRTRGFYYLLRGDQQKCVEEFGALLNRYPSDPRALNQIALCSTQLRNMPKAIEDIRRAVQILPKHALLRNNLALYASYSSDFSTGEREALEVQGLNPAYAKGYIALAFAYLGKGQLKEAAETYSKMAKLNAWGASNASSGLADIAVYEGRFSDALRLLEQGAAADLAAANSEQAAAKFVSIAYVQSLRGQKSAAAAAADKALANSNSVRTRFLAARGFIACGELAKAGAIAENLASESLPEPQAYAKLIEGGIALEKGDARAAVRLSTEANKLLDTWIGRFDLGRAYLQAGAFPEADSEFDRCFKRRGEAMALFLDEIPTYGYFPPLYYYQGRVREGMKSSGFAASYRAYLEIRGNAGEDPLLAEIRNRLK